jgi:hypothetical protein
MQPCLGLLFDIPPLSKPAESCYADLGTLVCWFLVQGYRYTGSLAQRPAQSSLRLPDFENFSHDAVAQYLWQLVPLRIRYDGLNFDHAKLSGENLKAHWLLALGYVTVEQGPKSVKLGARAALLTFALAHVHELCNSNVRFARQLKIEPQRSSFVAPDVA